MKLDTWLGIEKWIISTLRQLYCKLWQIKIKIWNHSRDQYTLSKKKKFRQKQFRKQTMIRNLKKNISIHYKLGIQLSDKSSSVTLRKPIPRWPVYIRHMFLVAASAVFACSVVQRSTFRAIHWGKSANPREPLKKRNTDGPVHWRKFPRFSYVYKYIFLRSLYLTFIGFVWHCCLYTSAAVSSLYLCKVKVEWILLRWQSIKQRKISKPIKFHGVLPEILPLQVLHLREHF